MTVARKDFIKGNFDVNNICSNNGSMFLLLR